MKRIIIFMGILSSLFGCKNSKENDEKQSPIETLEYAISDVGIWNWWTVDEEKSVQLEFDRAMLYFQTETETPSNRLALRFINPKSVTVLYDKESELLENWLEMFNADKIEPFNVDYENFSFDRTKFSKMVAKADNTKTIIGKDINDIDISNANLGFWAGEIGIIILADEMKIVNSSGEIPLENIPKLHNDWWNYWKKYWDLIDTNDKMPYDPLCEITIPATKQNIDN